jgi:uncharacterized protein (TIGR02246 family)
VKKFFGAAIVAALLACLVGTSPGLAEDAEPGTSREAKHSKPATPKAKSAAAIADEELKTIRAGSQKFVAAFNKGDAKAIAALWTEEGDYIDEAGHVYAGRAAIEKGYADFFQEHPGHKLHLAIDSLKLLSPDAAIEDGRATLEPAPPGPPTTSKYTAVHVKVAGRWLMSTGRDTRVETPSAYRNVQDLEWMIGSWSAEGHGAATDVTCKWVANKSFVERSYRVTGPSGQVISSGMQIIGWNPQLEKFQSWTFASDGGHALGTWTPRDKGWAVVSEGMLPDGTPMNAVTLLTHLDENTIAWQSVDRTAAGMAMPDTDEIILKRKTTSP